MSVPVKVINPDPRKIIPDEDMLRLVLDRFHASKDMVDKHRTKWKSWYRLYRSFVDNSKDQLQTQLFIPLIFSTVEAFLPRIVAQRPRIEVEARNDEDIAAASLHKQVLEYQWDYLRMPMKLVEFCKSSLIFGTAWLKLGWLKKTRKRPFPVKQTDPETGQTVTIDNVERDVVVYDAPTADVLDIGNVYPDPNGWSVDTCAYICEHTTLEWYEIDERAKPKEEGGLGWDREAVNKLKKLREAKARADLEADTKNRRGAEFRNDSPTNQDQLAHQFKFDVIEYWEDSRHAVVVLDPEIVLFNGPNPFIHGRKPYIRLVDNILPGEILGVGEPEVLESLNLELNAIHNLRLENVIRDVMQMFKVRVGSPAWAANIQFMPQGKIPVQDMDDIQELFTRGPKTASYREEDMIRLWAQQGSGATDPFMGLQSTGATGTATGATLLNQAASSRVTLKFQILTEMSLRPLGQMLVALNEQFMTDEQRIAIAGPEGQTHITVNPEQLEVLGSELDVRIDVAATEPINRELRLQRSVQALQVLGQLFQDPTHPVMQTLVKRILDLLDINVPPDQVGQRPQPLPTGQQTQQQGASLVENPTSRGGAGIADILANSQGAAGGG